MTFTEAWKIAWKIPGWFVDGEGMLLHRYANTVQENHCLVEVGCYYGKSLSLLASTGRKTYLIDPSTHLVKDVRELENVVFWNNTTEDCPDPEEPIGLLHIDGCHKSPWPLKDFERFWSYLAPGAIVMFHDIDDAPAVRGTVDELVGFGVLKPLERAGALGAYSLEKSNA